MAEEDRADGPLELLTTSEVAGMLGVVRSTVLSWAYRGLLDYTTTPGGQRRFYRAQVEAILSDGRSGPSKTSKPRHDDRR